MESSSPAYVCSCVRIQPFRFDDSSSLPRNKYSQACDLSLRKPRSKKRRGHAMFDRYEKNDLADAPRCFGSAARLALPREFSTFSSEWHWQNSSHRSVAMVKPTLVQTIFYFKYWISSLFFLQLDSCWFRKSVELILNSVIVAAFVRYVDLKLVEYISDLCSVNMM